MIHFPLLFHFNQHLTEFARLASHVCYRGLLRTLRANPAIKANIHISGTLITALKWLDPEPLEIIRDGLKEGQFELVGSTFAQNVPYATDDWDNAHQIDLHKQVLHDTFGVTPTTFWNAERCWRQSLVPVITHGGYQTVTIEDHILEQSGAVQAKIYQTRLDGAALNVVRDDEKLKHLFNFAAWFGNTRPLHKYLDTLPASAGEQCVLAYAEDAEAMGLWGYMNGILPNQTWERLDNLLKELAGRKDTQTILFSQIPALAEESTSEISPIADGAAAWMDASLAQSGLPYHEDGYQDWFDFNAHAPKLADFRQFYSDIRNSIKQTETTAKKRAVKKIYRLARHSYLTHQYEFGCIGIGGGQYRGWMGANAARVLDSAAALATLRKRSAEPIQFTIVDEVNHDGLEEWLHISEPNLLITSPIGGRLLYWLNLKNGQLLVGNPSAVVPGKYEGDSIPPTEIPHPNFWLPDGTPGPTRELAELPPTRMAKYLPSWVWEDHPDPVTLAVGDMRLEGEATYLTAQQGAFCDEILIDGHSVFNRRDTMEVEGSREAIRFYKDLGNHVLFQKKYVSEKNTISVDYTFTNRGKQKRKIRITTSSELALDYEAVLQHGCAALTFLPAGNGVVNPLTGETLTLSTTRTLIGVIRTPAMLGLKIGVGFEFDLKGGTSEKYTIQLSRGIASI